MVIKRECFCAYVVVSLLLCSACPQARKAYHPGEMRMNEQFHELHLEMRNGKLGLDFTHFDGTISSTGTLMGA